MEKKELVCHRLHLKDCQVRVRNLKIISTEAEKDGKCLELEDCEGAFLEGCTFSCASNTSDMAPYPASRNLAAAILCINSTVEIKNCSISAPGLDARGLVVEAGSLVEVTDTEFSGTFNSAVWCHGEGSKCTLTGGFVKQCGGYGALYCSHGGQLEASLVEEGGNISHIFIIFFFSRKETHEVVESLCCTRGAGWFWTRVDLMEISGVALAAGGVEGGASPTAPLTQMDRSSLSCFRYINQYVVTCWLRLELFPL